MPRSLVWTIDGMFQGWACSACKWKYPLPELLKDPDARLAYDRLASATFKEHTCDDPNLDRRSSSSCFYGTTISERSRKLIMQGLKLKDAVDIALQEVGLEFGDDTKAMEQARADATEFLRQVRVGLA